MAKSSNHQKERTKPGEERDEFLATAPAIARGGKNIGRVLEDKECSPVAGPPEFVMPPAPPGELPAEAVQKTQAIADGLAQLGEDAAPKRVAEAVKAQAGIDLDPGEVTQIMAILRERTRRPPRPDQPSQESLSED